MQQDFDSQLVDLVTQLNYIQSELESFADIKVEDISDDPIHVEPTLP